jgi:exopolysaccharide biosynthesis operon protein EpsL
LRYVNGAFGRAIVACAVAAGLPAHALWDDRLEVFVQENVTHDSNIFRISDNVSTDAIRSSVRGDTIFTTSAGFLLDVPVSLQRFQADFRWYDARYRRFDDLDHTGHIARAAWLWALTTRFTGDVTYNEQRGLASFANIQGREPDLVTARVGSANAAWMMTAAWRLHGALYGGEIEHSGERAVNDLRLRAVEAGLSFVSARENRIGVAFRDERGRNPRERLLFGLPFDNEYEQQSVGLQTRWVITGLSRLDGRLDYTRRRYEQLSERDYSGPTFSFTHTYTPTGKLTIASTARRDIAPLEDITSSFVLVTGITVRPDWALTDKLSLRGHFGYSRWEYTGEPLLGQEFEHRVRTAGGSLFWRPTRRIALSGGVAREVRTSTLTNGDYTVNTAFIEGRVGF